MRAAVAARASLGAPAVVDDSALRLARRKAAQAEARAAAAEREAASVKRQAVELSAAMQKREKRMAASLKRARADAKASDGKAKVALAAHLHRSGWTVALRDLCRRHDLNGVEGEVYQVAHHEGCVCVHLETGEYVRAWPENIEFLRTVALVSLGGIVRALRASHQEKTTGARSLSHGK